MGTITTDNGRISIGDLNELPIQTFYPQLHKTDNHHIGEHFTRTSAEDLQMGTCEAGEQAIMILWGDSNIASAHYKLRIERRNN
jgi:hypothetical protein